MIRNIIWKNINSPYVKSLSPPPHTYTQIKGSGCRIDDTLRGNVSITRTLWHNGLTTKFHKTKQKRYNSYMIYLLLCKLYSKRCLTTLLRILGSLSRPSISIILNRKTVFSRHCVHILSLKIKFFIFKRPERIFLKH